MFTERLSHYKNIFIGHTIKFSTHRYIIINTYDYYQGKLYQLTSYCFLKLSVYYR